MDKKFLKKENILIWDNTCFCFHRVNFYDLPLLLWEGNELPNSKVFNLIDNILVDVNEKLFHQVTTTDKNIIFNPFKKIWKVVPNNVLTFYLDKGFIKLDKDYFKKLKQYKEEAQKYDLNILRKELGAIKEIVPALDMIHNQIKMVYKAQFVDAITEKYYRFPDPRYINDKTTNRKCIQFYDLTVLKQTYRNLLPKDLLLDITYCMRPSYMYVSEKIGFSIKPFFSKNEIILAALNLGFISKEEIVDDEYYLETLCNQIKEHDVPFNNLLQHTEYIKKQDAIHYVRYYSFEGDVKMNNYLRNGKGTVHRNISLEKNILNLWDLINNAPGLEKDYSVYRFLGWDGFLTDLKIGDVYTSDSFMSTTRDPFYQNNVKYTFGSSHVMKINLPAKKKGMGLMLELYSHYPPELEYLLPAGIKLKLIRKGWKYYNMDKNIEKAIKNTYEFVVVGFDLPKIKGNYLPTRSPETLDIRKLRLKGASSDSKFNDLKKNHCNEVGQFLAFIGNLSYQFELEEYDSSEVLSPYYFYQSPKGKSIVLQSEENGSILLLLEIGAKEIHVNYHINFYGSEVTKKFNEVDLIRFLALMGRAFGIDVVYLYENKISVFEKITKKMGVLERYQAQNNLYSLDVYKALKTNSLKYSKMVGVHNTLSNKPIFELCNISIPDIFHENPAYLKYRTKAKKYNLKEFYLFLIDNAYDNIKNYENKINDWLKNKMKYFNKVDLFKNHVLINVKEFLTSS